MFETIGATLKETKLDGGGVSKNLRLLSVQTSACREDKGAPRVYSRIEVRPMDSGPGRKEKT